MRPNYRHLKIHPFEGDMAIRFERFLFQWTRIET